jgi:hypothetical protein
MMYERHNAISCHDRSPCLRFARCLILDRRWFQAPVFEAVVRQIKSTLKPFGRHGNAGMNIELDT